MVRERAGPGGARAVRRSCNPGDRLLAAPSDVGGDVLLAASPICEIRITTASSVSEFVRR
jgi:hypothetical protein